MIDYLNLMLYNKHSFYKSRENLKERKALNKYQNKYLNTKEYDVLNAILHAEEPMTVSQITKSLPELSANVVQPAIRKLLKLNLIEIADVVIDRNILSRCFRPTSSAQDIIRAMFVDDYIHFKRLISGKNLLSALVEADNNPETARQEISELEQLLEEYKKKY